MKSDTSHQPPATAEQRLSATEKLELIDMLWESLEGEVPALTQEQLNELDYRLHRYTQNPSDVIPWEEVKAELFKKQ